MACIGKKCKTLAECEKEVYEAYIRPSTNSISKLQSMCNLAPLPKAVPTACPPDHCHPTVCDCWNTQGPTLSDILGTSKQEGKTPMRYNDNYASASASVQAPQSDIAIQRDYLLSRLAKAKYPKEVELEKTFNLYVDNTPTNYQELIAAIKGGTYTIDPKIAAKFAADPDDYRYSGSMYGIVWDGPQPDRKGYDAALAALALQQVAARDTIMVSEVAAGLAALQAFEAWLPTTATATAN